MERKVMIRITMEDLQEAIVNNYGICTKCGAIGQFAEPDARNYTCEECGEDSVFGAEQVVIEMAVEVI
jgi:PHP family Zn ribbon phosphoesterase